MSKHHMDVERVWQIVLVWLFRARVSWGFLVSIGLLLLFGLIHFAFGGVTTILCDYIGMTIAAGTLVKTTHEH